MSTPWIRYNGPRFKRRVGMDLTCACFLSRSGLPRTPSHNSVQQTNDYEVRESRFPIHVGRSCLQKVVSVAYL